MSPRPDVSEERKNQILDAAVTVFTRLGFHKARMDDIVEESGLSKGALYWYFKSKDDIILAIMNRIFERELADLRILQQTEGSPSDRLMEFTENAIADLEYWLRMLPIAYEFLGLVFRQSFVQQAFKRYLRGYLKLLEPIIQQGIDQGEFRAIDAKDVAIAAGAIFEGTILLWVYDPETVDIAKHIRFGMNLLMDGLKCH